MVLPIWHNFLSLLSLLKRATSSKSHIKANARKYLKVPSFQISNIYFFLHLKYLCGTLPRGLIFMAPCPAVSLCIACVLTVLLSTWNKWFSILYIKYILFFFTWQIFGRNHCFSKEHAALRSNGKQRICICTRNTRFPCKALSPEVMSSSHHRTLRVIYKCCPVYEKWSAPTNYLCKSTKTQKNHSLEHTWLLLKKLSWQVLKVRKQLLKATSNFSYCALLYQLLFKGLFQDRVHLNWEEE